MQYAETLREVKKAEAEVRDLKADAQRQATQTLRDAEREANLLIEKGRQEADAAHKATLDAATKKANGNRTTRLQKGEMDANSVKARGASPDFKAAVDTLVNNLEKHVTSGK